MHNALQHLYFAVHSIRTLVVSDCVFAVMGAWFPVGLRLWKSRIGRKFPKRAVDKKTRPAHIPRTGAPLLLRLDGAPPKPSLIIRWQSFRLRSAAGGFDALWSPEGRGHCSAPGCLTSESEERETWTAESLRAVSSVVGAILRWRCGRKRLWRSTFQVNTMFANMCATRVACVGVNRVGPRQTL